MFDSIRDQNNTTFVDTNLSAHDGVYEYGCSISHSSEIESEIRWADASAMVTPNQLAPKAFVPNIKPDPVITGPRSIIVDTNATFTLGAAKDIENDQLEYRLYTRPFGTTDEPIAPAQTWTPMQDRQPVMVGFPDQSNIEWYISCIETDDSILDRTEVRVTPWNQLLVDTKCLIPHCYNVFNEEGWGTKGQALQMEVETNQLINYIEDFKWDFGDGSPEQVGLNITHVYTELGVYQIKTTACDEQGVTYTGEAEVRIVNTPKGPLYANENWSGTHLVTGDVRVPVGLTLTVEPGTSVQVKSGSGLNIEGVLAVQGPNVSFDRQDGTVDLWKGIGFNGQGSGTISGATIRDAERGVACTGTGGVGLVDSVFDNNIIGLHCYGGGINIQSCIFSNNLVYGIKEDHGCSPLVTNCIFQGNGINYYDQYLYGITAIQLNIAPNAGNEYR